MKMRITLSLAIFLVNGIVVAQKIQFGHIDVRGNKVILHYALNGSDQKQKYAVAVYSSADNFSKPLTRVSGDVGPDVRPGEDKRITWDITNEIGNFKGSISFEIRGTAVAAFLQIPETAVQKSYSRGKNYPLQWQSGNTAGQVNIELYKGNELAWRENNVPNNGAYKWAVPAKAKPGKDYRLRFVNSFDNSEFVFTEGFSIKPKTSMVLKIGAVALIGIGAAVLSGGKGGGEAPTGTKLPDPPAAPGG